MKNKLDEARVHIIVSRIIAEALLTNPVVEIKGFGVWRVLTAPARDYKLPSGEIRRVPPKRQVRFRPSIVLKRLIKQEAPT